MKLGLLATILCILGVATWKLLDTNRDTTSPASPKSAAGRQEHPSAFTFVTKRRESHYIEFCSTLPRSLLGRSGPLAAATSGNPTRESSSASRPVRRKTVDGSFGGAPAGIIKSAVSSTKDGLPIELAPGVRRPVALLSFENELPPPVQRSLTNLGTSFTQELLANVADQGIAPETPIPLPAWEMARSTVDYQFCKLFGAEAYNRAGVVAALEAMQSASKSVR